MKIYSAAQTRDWDAYTIEHEPIASIGLMNRAVQAFVHWFVELYPPTRPVQVFCGTGNNGGDGIGIARQLSWLGYDAKVVVCDFAEKRSVDFEAQVAALGQQKSLDISWWKSLQPMPEAPAGLVLIDALFGTGLSRPLTGEWAQLIDLLNQTKAEIVSVDLPSGLFADATSTGQPVIRATRTFCFERPKLACLLPENGERVGELSFGNIGLHTGFEAQTETPYFLMAKMDAAALYRPRPKFAHKGSFGHALLIAGSFGKMGAAVLAAKACLASGVGLLSVHAPRSGNIILQTAVPEAMVSADHRAKLWMEVPDTASFASIGVGPGIGQDQETAAALHQLLFQYHKPMVIDADALNLLAQNPAWWNAVPQNSILTPHPKEFERLFGKTTDDFERLELLRNKAIEYGIFILLKGAHTAIACPDGTCWFNSTGNPGMASGGTGDVLTGIITGLLAQGYPPKSAALIGVYVHGLAGDHAAREESEEALTAGKLVDFMGKAWLEIKANFLQVRNSGSER